jgi:UDP:flavonoid glycosyltransferase YjiC (YdhE family)
VRWYTGQKYRDIVERAGAQHEPYRRARDFDDHHMERAFPERARLEGLKQLEHDLLRVFVDQTREQLLDLEQLRSSFAPHVVIADPFMAGALILKERHGTPLVLINVVANPLKSRDTAPFGLGILPSERWYGALRNRALTLLLEHVLLRDVHANWARVRSSLGLSTRVFFTDAPLIADLFLQPTVAGFEYPRSDLPSQVQLVGALPTEPPAMRSDASFLARLSPDRPLIHVTQGTMSNARPWLIEPALRGLARERVHVVVTTGGRGAPELGLSQIPENAHVVSFLSYDELLPRTSVMVTNGGYGGVHLALSHGVPLVVWGTSEDKPETAARVAWSGVGVRLSGARPSARAVRNAVREVLDHPRYRKRAGELAHELSLRDAVATVVALVEERFGSDV